MPSALELAEEYGDALQVIFVECRGATRDQYEAFVWKQEWMGPGNTMVEAEKHLDKLAKDVKGAAELETLVSAESARLAEPGLAAERDAAKAVAAFFGQVAKKKPFDGPDVQKAASLAEKRAGTKSAERAARFAALSKVRAGD